MAAKSPGRRFLKLLISLGVIAVLLAAGVFVAERALKKIVPEQFASHTREFLQLSDDHPVDVQLHGFLLGQLLLGQFNDVSVAVNDVPVQQGMRVDLRAHADKMPKNPVTGEIIGGVVSATLSEEQLQNLIRDVSFGLGQDVQIEADHLSITNNISLFGQQIPVVLSLAPSAKDGALHIEPVAVSAAGLLDISLSQLPNFAGLQDISNGFDFCVADRLPRGVKIESIEMSTARSLTVSASIDPQIGLKEELQEFGSCD